VPTALSLLASTLLMLGLHPVGGAATRRPVLADTHFARTLLLICVEVKVFGSEALTPRDHAVGIDRIIAEAGVANATLYHHFGSKEALVIAFLDLRQQRWTFGWLKTEAERRATQPRGRVLAVFDALDDRFRTSDFEGCSFIATLLEINDRDSAVHREAARHLATIRDVLAGFLADAGALDPEAGSHKLQILAMGAIVSAGRGDLDAARRARPLAASLLPSAARAGAMEPRGCSPPRAARRQRPGSP
jgi:AcrR family transcriptional regulator